MRTQPMMPNKFAALTVQERRVYMALLTRHTHVEGAALTPAEEREMGRLEDKMQAFACVEL
jgi:hypothetical protein